MQSWDTESTEGVLNDWSVCISALVRQQKIYVIDVWRKKVTFPDLRKAAIANARTHDANVLLIKDQASGTQLIQALRAEEPRGVPSPIPRRPDADKRTRLAGVSAMIEAGQLLLPAEASWLGAFEHELLAFPSSRHDDQVDALSQLLQWVQSQHRHTHFKLAGPVIIYPDGRTSERTTPTLSVYDVEDPWL